MKTCSDPNTALSVMAGYKLYEKTAVKCSTGTEICSVPSAVKCNTGYYLSGG